MALNYTHRPAFTVPERNVVSSSSRRNGGFVEGVTEYNGDGSAWNPCLSRHKSCESCDRCNSRASGGVDIIDLLPRDPFGMDMDISSTFTAINNWLEDLDINCDERECQGGNKGGNPLLIKGFNLFWSNAVRFHSLRENVGGYGGNTCNAGPSGVGGSLSEVINDVGFGLNGGEESLTCNDGDQNEECSVSSDGVSNDDDNGTLHLDVLTDALGLMYELDYFGVQDMLRFEMVCRKFRSAIVDNPSLWMNIHVDHPLNEKITDDALIRLTSRAQGNLNSLTLVECSKITNDGLNTVLQRNPKITKLSVPGCTRLSIESIISSLKASKSKQDPPLKQLRVAGLYQTEQQHFEELQLLLNVNDVQQRDIKPRFYQRGNIYLSRYDDRAIDIEVCPKCQNPRLVYDCPADGCQLTENSKRTCRACAICIRRCVQCGRCIDHSSQYEETFLLELVCSECGN